MYLKMIGMMRAENISPMMTSGNSLELDLFEIYSGMYFRLHSPLNTFMLEALMIFTRTEIPSKVCGS